jgi:hypothetical protein
MAAYNTNPLTEDQAKAVYQILVDECGARAEDPYEFVLEFTSDSPCNEWRFQGSLGFGGKFRYPKMSVDCYTEDETKERNLAIQKANTRLEELKKTFEASAG